MSNFDAQLMDDVVQTGLPVQTIKSQFAKVNWKNLRGAAIGAVGV